MTSNDCCLKFRVEAQLAIFIASDASTSTSAGAQKYCTSSWDVICLWEEKHESAIWEKNLKRKKTEGYWPGWEMFCDGWLCIPEKLLRRLRRSERSRRVTMTMADCLMKAYRGPRTMLRASFGILIQSSQQPYDRHTTPVTILEIRNKEAEWFTQGIVTNKWRKQDSNPERNIRHMVS